jgi:HAMP domain-containing protein
MTTEGELLESNALRELKRLAKERGFEFILHPAGDVIPGFLGGYEPDAIVKRPDGGGIIVEVKGVGRPSSDHWLSEISKRVSRENGWEFRVIHTPPAQTVAVSFAEPTPEQITRRLGEIEDLVRTGHRVPALILGWAVLEALARLASSHDGSKHLGPLSPVQAVQVLAEEGYLENDAADALRRMSSLRNAVVHGDLAADVPAEQADALIARLHMIATDVIRIERAQALASQGGAIPPG